MFQVRYRNRYGFYVITRHYDQASADRRIAELVSDGMNADQVMQEEWQSWTRR